MNSLLKILSQVDITIDELDIPNPGTPTGSTVSDVLFIAFLLAGSISVLVMIYAGIQFMLSQGDPGKTATARNTIIYAAIGLTITALSFTIVKYVAGLL